MPDISKFVVNFVSGKVLVTGGTNDQLSALATADFYSNIQSFAATGKMTNAPWRHTQTLLHTGKTPVAGGLNGSGCFQTAELYDPSTRKLSATGSMARCDHSATLLGDGTFLIAGGDSLQSAEIYNPVSRVFTDLTAQMTTTRSSQAAVLLQMEQCC